MTNPLSVVVLDVSPDKTIQQVKQMVQEKDSTIETSNLIFEQKPLDDSKTLADYNITDNSDLYFATPTTDNKSEVSTNTRPQKKSRKRCSFKSCVSAPLRGVGDCGFCDGHFCSKHRLLEQHDCIGLHNCKQQLHE